jgi:hypothetical protein
VLYYEKILIKKLKKKKNTKKNMLAKIKKKKLSIEFKKIVK